MGTVLWLDEERTARFNIECKRNKVVVDRQDTFRKRTSSELYIATEQQDTSTRAVSI